MKIAYAATLLGVVQACDVQTLGAQTELMNSKCCAGGTCDATGVPTVCSAECAPAFKTFWNDCGAYLNYLPGAELMQNFATLCEDSKPDEHGSKVTSCDSGALVSTLLFSCSGVDQNDKQQFCNSECSRGVQDYVSRCRSRMTDTARAAFKRAEGWLNQCVESKKEASCHASNCVGNNEMHCTKAKSRGACNKLNAAENNVFCRWQSCNVHAPPPPPGGKPPPPPAKRSGCTDHKALNYNPKANVMAPGSCLYAHAPTPPGPPQPCNERQVYGCKTKEACEGAKMQWVPCAETEKFGGQCYGLSEADGGQCARPCSEAEPQNCHTPDKCRAVSKCQDNTPDMSCTNRTTQWFTRSDAISGSLIKEPSRCERGCSIHSMYTCRDETSCVALGQQWVPGITYHDKNGQVTRTTQGQCETKCSAKIPSRCHSRSMCEGIGHQWISSTCCGTGCGQYSAGHEAGSCQEKCTLERPYECHTQVDCEAVSRQWVPSTTTTNLQCNGAQPQGSCSRPCTEDNYFNCRTKVDCEAIDLQWKKPIVHKTSAGHEYTEPGRCTYPCSLANPNSCDTKDECQSIGFEWQKIGTASGDIMIPNGRTGFCQRPCYVGNPSGCKSQRECETQGEAQWVMEEILACNPEFGCPIIDPGFGGGGGGIGPVIIDDGMEPRRQLQAVRPPSPPIRKRVGRCEPKCSEDSTYQCKTKKACKDIDGIWTARQGNSNDAASPSGYCQKGCSTASAFMCKTKRQCQKIGGEWKAHHQLGRPTTETCDVTSAPCDADLFLEECGTTRLGKIDKEGLELCDDKCGRYIMNNYDRCSKFPPKGISKQKWKRNFGPIVQLCKSFREDPSQERCVNQLEVATTNLNTICCNKHTKCTQNGGAPTRCSGACADVFVPFFEECGSIFMENRHDRSALGKFYHTCTAQHGEELESNNRKLCVANNGNAPFTAIEFRANCQVWIKYVDAKTKGAHKDFVQMVAVEHLSIAQLLDVAKSICGKPDMIKRMAVDFSGILALAGVDEKGDTLTITINHPTTGNTDVVVINNGRNKRAVTQQWKSHFNVNVFSPDKCPLQ